MNTLRLAPTGLVSALVRSLHAIVAGRDRAHERLKKQEQRLKRLLDRQTVMLEKLAAAETEARRSRDQLRRLTASVQAAREDERARVSREIRDELGQVLTSMKLDLGWLARNLPPGPDVDECAWRILAMSDLADDALVAIRELAATLRPALLDDLGLTAAMEWQMRDFNRQTGCSGDLVLANPDLDLLGPDRDTVLFRIFQEALANIALHQTSKRVAVSLRAATDDRLEMVIECDGLGISAAPASECGLLWLSGARERVRELGGVLSVTEATATHGTRLEVSVPIAASAWLDRSAGGSTPPGLIAGYDG